MNQVFALLTLCLLSTKVNAESVPAFEYYLLENSKVTGYETLKEPLSKLKLKRKPLWTDTDFKSYNCATHEFTLNKNAARIPSGSINGLPYVVVANGERIYAGAFWSMLSSATFPSPVIKSDPPLASDKLVVQRAYPGAGFEKGPDPRIDPRLILAMKTARILTGECPK